MFLAVLRFLALLPLNFFVTIAGRLLNPIVVLFASNDGWLPKWLWWFQTPDNSLDGDEGWQSKKWFKGSKTRIARYINRVRWLMRNNCNGFHLAVTGFKVAPIFKYVMYGDELVGNRPLHNGWVLRRLTQGNKTYFQFYFVKAWTSRFCIRILLGWKLWSAPKPGEQKMYSFNLNPFMGYSK